MAELRVTPAALGDLENIWSYTAQQWGEKRVERHTVYYRVEDAMVVIVRVLHERMDAPRHL